MNKKRIRLSTNAGANLLPRIEDVRQSVDNEIARSKEKERELSAEISNKVSKRTIVWDENSNIDEFVVQGVYVINGERLNLSDGLPVRNGNPGHTIAATLIVADSTINSNERCVTQMLLLSNRLGADGNLYLRTATGDANGLVWASWGKMQTNIETGAVTSLDNYVDNGIYSGILLSGDTAMDMFLLVVLNNYPAANTIGATRTVSQFKYSLSLNGSVTFKSRSGGGAGMWGAWKDVGVPDNGETDCRPSHPVTGSCFYDTALGKPVWWNGTVWTDAVGNVV